MCTQEYYLPSTNDSTDRTGDILRMLEEHGACQLGSGIYVVAGVDMPDSTSLMGVGNSTVVLLREDVTSGYAVKLGSYCRVRDMQIKGSAERIERPEQVGDRHGIVFLGNAKLKDSPPQPRHPMISGCFLSSFTGGGITCRDTGYSSLSSLLVSDCQIVNCGAGINIAHFSEYHKFTNVLVGQCLYGCVNNGGNNVFVNCGFNSNKVGFFMDNSHGQSNNNSHGSAVGCTFNHSDNNEGIGILAIGMRAGYMFTGCQVFFSKIVLEDCEGFIFDTFNYGRKVELHVKGGKLVMFSNSVFRGEGPDAIEIADNSLVKFVNCYTRDGRTVGA